MLALHRHIHRALVVCMPPERPDLLLDMVAESGKLGPRNISLLKNKLDPQHIGTTGCTLAVLKGHYSIDPSVKNWVLASR